MYRAPTVKNVAKWRDCAHFYHSSVDSIYNFPPHHERIGQQKQMGHLCANNRMGFNACPVWIDIIWTLYSELALKLSQPICFVICWLPTATMSSFTAVILVWSCSKLADCSKLARLQPPTVNISNLLWSEVQGAFIFQGQHGEKNKKMPVRFDLSDQD